MAIKRFKPMTPGTRFKTVSSFDEITTTKPEKSLLDTSYRTGGRNNTGRIPVRHIGGGNRIKYRIIDFKRNKDNIPARVAEIEYDPNRTAYIALLHYALPLQNIPVGTMVHNIELQPGRGGQMAKAAGSAAQLMAKEGKYATLRLPSGEMRMIPLSCKATVGQVGNLDHELVSLGKAGRKRHMGVKPTVRGVVMNPCDHPHGGGEGKSPIGRPGPVSPWGQPALGYKTRKKHKNSDRFIVKRIN